MSAVARALASARRGSGNLVVIHGPAGIGKSRLLDATRTEALANGMSVLDARGVELEREVPFGVAARLFTATLADAVKDDQRRLLAGPAALTGVLVNPAVPAPEPDALVRGLYWLTANLTTPDAPRAPHRPYVLIIDDAQWADRPSLGFLAHLAARVEELPVTLVVATRSGEPGSAPEILDWLRLHAGSRILRPAALTTEAVGQLVRNGLHSADPLFVATCAQVSGGNPFLVCELVRALAAEGVSPTAASVPAVERLVPDSVLRSLLVRVARLPEAMSRLAAAVAVLGDDTPLRHAAALADLDPHQAEEAADTLAATGLFAAGEPLHFAHPLIATAVYQDLPDFARARAHRRAAGLLAAENPASDTAAAHLLATRPDGDPQTVRMLQNAAQRALNRGDPGAAVHLLERALLEPPRAADRVEVLLELAEAKIRKGDPEAEGTINDAISASEDPASHIRALWAQSKLRSAQGDHDAADRAIQQALALVEPADPLAQTLMVDQLTASTFRARLHPAATARLKPILAAARAGHPPGHPGLLAHVALRLALAGAPGTQIRELAERATAADPLIDPVSHGILAGMLVQALACVDELDTAERVADQALGAAVRRGSLLAYAIASYHRAIPRYHRGALVDALADLDQALTASREGWTAADGWIRTLQVHLMLERGQRDAARETLNLVPPPPPGSMDEAIVLHARACLALADRDHPAALASAQAAGRLLADGFDIDNPGLLPWRHTASLAAAALGQRAQSQHLAEQARERANQCQVPRALGMALHLAALLADDQRIPLLHQAVTVLEQSPSKLTLAHALVDLGTALRRSGQRADAQSVLRRGLELSDGMGAAPLAAEARLQLRATGARPRGAATTGAASLTPTERRVADLAAEGLTNPQIAQTLFVTTKTVQTHLANTYRKLGIHSRNALHPILTAPGLVTT
jgi:DNA-binding CsgD family transcriptional regulator